MTCSGGSHTFEFKALSKGVGISDRGRGGGVNYRSRNALDCAFLKRFCFSKFSENDMKVIKSVERAKMLFYIVPKNELNTFLLKSPRHQPQFPLKYPRDCYLIASEPFQFLLTNIPTQISTSTCRVYSKQKYLQYTQTKSTIRQNATRNLRYQEREFILAVCQLAFSAEVQRMEGLQN